MGAQQMLVRLRPMGFEQNHLDALTAILALIHAPAPAIDGDDSALAKSLADAFALLLADNPSTPVSPRSLASPGPPTLVAAVDLPAAEQMAAAVQFDQEVAQEVEKRLSQLRVRISLAPSRSSGTGIVQSN
eukprot:COSAG01_NODE_1647_length_9631_cov_82.855644_2_plen_131_part_00